MTADKAGWLGRFRRTARETGASAPALPLLEHVRTLEATDWLRASMVTFARTVASFLPGHFESYARVYHPFVNNDGTASAVPTWHELAAAAGADLDDALAWEALPTMVERHARVDVGSLPQTLIEPLIEHLAPATTTPGQCFFAVWVGFGGSAVPHSLEPQLELPGREYHVFAGPVEGARTSFAETLIPWVHQSANLWWPADHAWCVATEVDLAWTYVGGPRSVVRALLADPRVEAVETMAAARW
jgi:hypothetical protein